MNEELGITNYETNLHRHAELDSASPAYKAFNKGIAGQARNDGAANLQQRWILKTVLILISISFFFVSCTSTKKIYRNYYPSPITRSSYVEMVYPDGIVSIDPNDTITIKKYSRTETFTITDIEIINNVYYRITVQSDSINTYFYNGIEHSYNPICEIISLKTKNIKLSEKIKKGQRYKFTLIPCFTHPERNIIPIHMYMYVYTKGLSIPVVVVGNIFTTPNLEGLYYIKPNHKNKINDK